MFAMFFVPIALKMLVFSNMIMSSGAMEVSLLAFGAKMVSFSVQLLSSNYAGSCLIVFSPNGSLRVDIWTRQFYMIHIMQQHKLHNRSSLYPCFVLKTAEPIA
jgi:hypothetical protein